MQLSNHQTISLDSFIRRPSIDEKIPEQYDDDRRSFGDVVIPGMWKEFVKDQRIRAEKDDLIDDQPHHVDERELRKLRMQWAQTRFGKSPQTIPRKIAEDGARDRREICIFFRKVESKHQ